MIFSCIIRELHNADSRPVHRMDSMCYTLLGAPFVCSCQPPTEAKENNVEFRMKAAVLNKCTICLPLQPLLFYNPLYLRSYGELFVPHNPIWKIDNIENCGWDTIPSSQWLFFSHSQHSHTKTHATGYIFDAIAASSDKKKKNHIWSLTTDSILNSFSFRDSYVSNLSFAAKLTLCCIVSKIA